MTDNQYAAIKSKAAQLLPPAAAGLGLGSAGLQITVDNMQIDGPSLDTTQTPPAVLLSTADYRDLIRRLRLEP